MRELELRHFTSFAWKLQVYTNRKNEIEGLNVLFSFADDMHNFLHVH